MFTAAVCAREGAAAGWIEKVSERLQACEGASCVVRAASWVLTCVVGLLFSQGAGGRAVREPRGRV